MDFKHRCNCNGKELRNTHFKLGTYDWNPETTYTNQFPPKMSSKDAPQIDNISLRKTNFILGDDNPPLETNQMIETAPLENYPPQRNNLDENLKNDLRKSHFILGNYEPNYNTTFKAEYYDKSNYAPINIDYKKIERKFRDQNFNFGTDNNDYMTETQAKFKQPNINKDDLPNQKISTKELQNSHYKFGIFPSDYNTTHRISYPPKKVDFKLDNKNLTKTNFILGEDKPVLKSVNQETYIKHQPIKLIDKLNKSELINDLRNHHFEFGKENIPMQTTNNFAFQDPGIADNAKPLLNNQKLRESNWSLGDKK